MRGLVCRGKLERALRLLNAQLGSASLADDLDTTGLGTEYDELQGGGVVKLGSGHHCTCCLAQAAPLLDLMGEEERAAVAAAIGEPQRRISSTFGAQVALRFPQRPFAAGFVDGEAALPPLLERAKAGWHTDAAKYNDKKSFDFVVGIFLSDVDTRAAGNLWVQPGSHLLERPTREASDQTAAAPRCTAFCHGLEHALPITASAGDAIVFDRDLVHMGGPNLSCAIRYACYYRLRWDRNERGGDSSL